MKHLVLCWGGGYCPKCGKSYSNGRIHKDPPPSTKEEKQR